MSCLARFRFLLAVSIFVCAFLVLSSPAQQLAKRLILKDGSYQLATKWEVKGERVRYYSAERAEWEEVPNSMVDWAATNKYEKEREAGAALPGAAELDQELAKEQAAEDAKTPQVAPGLRLPESSSGVFLLDSFQNQPQLIELQQSGGEINQNRKGNILRAAINPVASAKRSIELPGAHAKVQAHAAVPSIYVKLEAPDQTTAPQQPELPWDRFRIVRMETKTKQGKRIVGDIKVAIYGKVSQEQKLVPSISQELSGGWVKVTPNDPLAPGEYALVEMLGKEGINLYVWDFGVNPSAPANPMAMTPAASASPSPPDQPPGLQKRQ
jgi:hypothetical protein